MNRCIIFLAIITLTASLDNPAQTKQTATPEAQEIKVKTELMEVRAVVTDRKGQIVENLKKEDFELLEDGHPQEISFFSVSQVERSQPDQGAPAKKGVTQETVAAPQRTLLRLGEPPVRATLLYVDTLHLSFSSLNRVKEALRRFVKERLTEQDAVALATSGQTLGAAQQFTRDRQLLNHAIEQIRPGPESVNSFFTPTLAAGVIAERQDAYRLATAIVRSEEGIECPCDLLLSRARARAQQILYDASYSRKATLLVLKDFAEQMVRLPGKRMIVLFSDGFTMHDYDGGLSSAEINPTISRAVRSGVTIYSIDSKGLQTPPEIDAGQRAPWAGGGCPGATNPNCSGPGPGDLAASLSVAEQEQLNAMHSIAQETGGKLYSNSNDLGAAIDRAFDANRFYYVLSYYLRTDGSDRKFRTIKVQVRNHPGYTVQTAKGFNPFETVLTETETGKTPQERLLRAMRAPLPVTDIGVSAQADFIETDTDDKQVSLCVYFAGDRLQYREKDQRNVVGLEILYVVYDSAGKQVEGTSAQVEGTLTWDRMAQAKTRGYQFSRRLTLKPGVYQVSVGVREEGTDRTGTATAWVQVPEIAKHKLEMSSLMLRAPLFFYDEPVVKDGINVSELEQVKMVQGIPLYARTDFCDYFFRLYPGAQPAVVSNYLFMKEYLLDGKTIRREPWQPVSAEEDAAGKGWFDVEGELDLSEFNPGVYEMRVSVKDARSNKIVERTVVFGVELGAGAPTLAGSLPLIAPAICLMPHRSREKIALAIFCRPTKQLVFQQRKISRAWLPRVPRFAWGGDFLRNLA